ncbi:MAG: ABC transporter ATP-binding protein [Acidobacteria bacterium]|nr:ABC transporter ATP-binding protein [Acidobacteriota bacterium]
MASSSRPPAVVVKDLERRFGNFIAVHRISFEVGQGEIFGFLGPNGAGKSTTIRMLCGLLAPTGGGGTVAGFDILTEAEQIKANIGYMSQRFSLYEDLTVEENIDFYSGIYRIPGGKMKERKRWVLEMASLEQHRRALTGHLASGWKQRLALGCAILHEPSILFLDEPTSGVDPQSRRRFWDLIYDLSSRGITVFVTTHYLEEAEHCGRVGLIYRGQLIAGGSPESLKKEQMQGEILEILCERPADALDEIEPAKGVKAAALFGKSLHVIVGDAKTQAPLLTNLLEQKGYPVRSAEKIVPSLEDVFVAMIETYDREHPPLEEVSR